MPKQLLEYSFVAENFKSNFTVKGTAKVKVLLIVTIIDLRYLLRHPSVVFSKFSGNHSDDNPSLIFRFVTVSQVSRYEVSHHWWIRIGDTLFKQS